jgi:glycosyltransferase involved in cell wall biosynthesis
MAMALPTIASETEVHREYLGKLGIYVPAGDMIGLVNAIKNQAGLLVEGDNHGQQLRQRAIDSYSWDRAGEEISQLYLELVRGQQINT